MKYRFNEDKILKEISDYVASTYSSHYVNEKAGTKDEEIKTIDVWKQMGQETAACHSNIIKYAMRYGKKEGYNKKDLMKIIHYTILLWHFTQDQD
jgi:hypothetical protein